jgi:hypothetical protein
VLYLVLEKASAADVFGAWCFPNSRRCGSAHSRFWIAVPPNNFLTSTMLLLLPLLLLLLLLLLLPLPGVHRP